jgi:hypothetical protein
MGKAGKTIAVVAAVGFTVWATGGIGAQGWLINTATHAGGLSAGTLFTGAGAGSGIASLFAGSSPASLALAGFGAISSLAAANARANDAALRGQEEQRRIRLARLQALQTEAAALKGQGQARGAAIAKAAAQGQDLGGRSFMAFLDDQEREGRSQIDTIKVNAEAGIQTSQIRIRQFAQQGNAAIFEGAGGAARSLLTARA